jgi:hypothetical protein
MANMTINQLFKAIEQKGIDSAWDSDKVNKYYQFVRELIVHKLIDKTCGFPESNIGEVMAEVWKRSDGNSYEMLDEIYILSGKVPVRLSLQEQGLEPYSEVVENVVETTVDTAVETVDEDAAVQFNDGSITINLKLLMKNGIKKLTIIL